jgi:hypothetical protein
MPSIFSPMNLVLSIVTNLLTSGTPATTTIITNTTTTRKG